MKLPFTRGDAASLLQKEIAAEAAATAKLADMRAARSRTLLETDDLTVIEKHDADIAALERQISIHQDRILALDARLAKEAEQQRRMKYAEAIAVVERLLPLREAAAGEVEKAMLNLASSCQKFAEITNSITAQYPAGLGSRPDYHLSLRPLGERLRNCFAMGALIYATTKAPPAAQDFVRRACDAADRADGFAAAAVKDHSELIDELKSRGTPPAPAVDEEAA
jgi:hypothetical protein